MLLLSTSFCPESAALDSADSSLRPVRVRESSLLSLYTSLSASSIDCCSSFLDSSNDFVSEVPFEEVLFEEAPFDCPDGLLDDCPAAAPSESAFGSCNAVSAFFSWMLFKLAFRESVALSNVLAVFGSVEHGFAGRAEFRERLPACGQCFLLLVAVNAHAGTACHDEGHDHGKDDRPCLAGAGRLFSGLVLIIHTCHPLRTDSCHRSSSC